METPRLFTSYEDIKQDIQIYPVSDLTYQYLSPAPRETLFPFVEGYPFEMQDTTPSKKRGSYQVNQPLPAFIAKYPDPGIITHWIIYKFIEEGHLPSFMLRNRIITPLGNHQLLDLPGQVERLLICDYNVLALVEQNKTNTLVTLLNSPEWFVLHKLISPL